MSTTATDVSATTPMSESTWVWGVPFSRVTYADALAKIDQLIAGNTPNFLITANLHYAMLSAGDQRLRQNNSRAAMILADGMPIVWASRWRDHPLPERVTGSDIVPLICERAAEKGYGIYLLGAAPGIAEEASRRLCKRFPALRIVGVHAPPFRMLSPDEERQMCDNIRLAKPDILLIAFGQPKGEYWVADNYQALGVPVVMQVGATLDFIAGSVHRAPRWMQQIGCEWVYRFLTEPKRLGRRYVGNAWFAMKMLIRDMTTRRSRRR